VKITRLIIGAGLYGLYSALFCAKQGDTVCVLEREDAPFKRATYVNQSRVHMGYHYPRSISTALKSRGYFDRFNDDYGFCLYTQFDQVYATSSNFSWTNADQFRKFCKGANLRCDDVEPTKYFNDGMCDGAFLTTEYTYDAQILKDHLIQEIAKYPNVVIRNSARIKSIEKKDRAFLVSLETGETYESGFVLNATYASINQIQAMLGYEAFKIKYELCEIILCKINDELKNTGITVMDGPFFSIMPFGKTGYHSLTTVTHTPHKTSLDSVPTFDCQARSGGQCSPQQLGNCNHCPAKPESAWPYMSNLARKYMKEKYKFEYVDSLFSMKPILRASEIDDSRPTVIRQYSSTPTFISVLSGKINTIYDLDEVLKNGNE
jgi:hypothetical protein